MSRERSAPGASSRELGSFDMAAVLFAPVVSAGAAGTIHVVSEWMQRRHETPQATGAPAG